MPADHDRPRKRQRTTLACQRCRGKKFRCDGETPSCGACLTAQSTCSYDTSSGRQRGLKPGYVKVLETLWGSVFQHISGSERVASHLLASLPALAENTAGEVASGDDASPLQIWRNSSIPEAIRSFLDGRSLPTADGAGVVGTAWNLPPSSGPDNLEPYVFDALPPSPSPSRVPVPYPSLQLPDLPQDWQMLVQIYLCSEYCCLPIFAKSYPYRWAYKYQDDAASGSRDLEPSHCGQYASLWAVLVLGEIHLHGSDSTRLGEMKQTAKMLLASVELRGVHQTFSYAFLLWALVYTGSRAFTLARMMLAQAMILDDACNESTKAQANVRESLLQVGCFVMETILALATGTRIAPVVINADAFSSGDVGEWDPFINDLEQGPGTIALNLPRQLPPSRTGSTFRALAKLLAILRKVDHHSLDPEALSAELKAWETSLAADLRGAVLAHVTPPQIPVPSQLHLKSWYGLLCCKISELKPSATNSSCVEESESSALRIIRALQTTGQVYGMSMLPATSSVIFARVSQLSDSLPDGEPTARSQLVTTFSRQWGWLDLDRGIPSDLTADGNPATQVTTDQSVIRPPPIHEGPSGTAVPGRQDCGHDPMRDAADATSETMSGPGLLAIEHDNNTSALSRGPPNTDVGASVAGSFTARNLDSCLQPSPSYDLLEYLTMFENSNLYVDSRNCSGSVPLQSHSLIFKAVTIETTWSLLGT